MTQETERRRKDYSFDVVIACLNAVIVALICWPAWKQWRHGEIDNSLKLIGIVPILILVSLFKVFRFRNSILSKDVVALVCTCFALITAYWMSPQRYVFSLLLVLLLLLVVWRANFHARRWRLNRKISRNLSRIRYLNSGPRTSIACKRLPPSAIRGFLVVFVSLVLIITLRYWHVGDHVSSVALAAVCLYGAVNVALRFRKRRQPPGDFKERQMYVFWAISAIHAAIFGFVAIRSWQRDGSLLWSGLCWAVAFTDVFLSTSLVVMYFRFRKRTDAIATPTAQSS